MYIKPRYRFLFKNLAKGLLWFAVLVVLFVIFKQYLSPEPEQIEQLKPLLVYGIFLFSEVVFGIIPPEIFIWWSLHGGATDHYAFNVLLLSVISFSAGISGYFIGTTFRKLPIFITIQEKYLDRYRRDLKRYGGVLVIAAAVTPIPFSAVAMAVAAFRYPFKYFVIYSLTRFLRFGIIGYVIWQANVI